NAAVPVPADKRDDLVNKGRKTMRITRRTALTMLGGGVVAGTLGGTLGSALAADPSVGIVVKIGGIPWFNAMEVGIKKAAPEFKMDAWMVGPTQADAAQQV